MEAEPSTLTLSTLFPQTTDCHAIRHRFDFDLSPKSCSEASNDVWLQTASWIAIQASFPMQLNLFWTNSETLYPSRLISFPTNPSLCPSSPKRWVLETNETWKGDVNREQ
jgi:hypothetical protein